MPTDPAPPADIAAASGDNRWYIHDDGESWHACLMEDGPLGPRCWHVGPGAPRVRHIRAFQDWGAVRAALGIEVVTHD